ncbi:MAG: undecaprenyl-diphosphate phosphatase [Rhodobacteraceae bacterium]|nr:undecaprenyl-diphosphate phosphatase [Paracoccaceae bacterium]
MDFLHLLLLALIQGITEFLPVSSSGHLVLLPRFLDVADQGLMLDVAVHVGTLGAVMLYFWRDMLRIACGLGHAVTGRFSTPEARLFLLLSFATIPVIIAGLLLKMAGMMEMMRNIEVIGWTMLVFGIVLYIADRFGPEIKKADGWNWRDALLMGLAQAVALIPGTSRSGITITAARALGYTRTEGARLSMLMSIPTILASGVLLGKDVVEAGDWSQLREAGMAAALAFLSALLALSLMMRLLKSTSFTPYVIYRIGLGVVLLVIAYS